MTSLRGYSPARSAQGPRLFINLLHAGGRRLVLLTCIPSLSVPWPFVEHTDSSSSLLEADTVQSHDETAI